MAPDRLYWSSPDAAKGGLLLALAVALELGTVYGSFVLADAQRRIYDVLQDRLAAAFLQGIGLFIRFASRELGSRRVFSAPRVRGWKLGATCSRSPVSRLLRGGLVAWLT